MNELHQHIAVKKEASNWDLQKGVTPGQHRNSPALAVIVGARLLYCVCSWHSRVQKTRERMTDSPEK